MPPRRWRQFLADSAAFLDSPLAAQASELGWTSLDLFGADRDKPYARIDQAGLLWLLNGDRLLWLTQDRAMIETKSGAHHTFRRRLVGEHCGTPWSLLASKEP